MMGCGSSSATRCLVGEWDIPAAGAGRVGRRARGIAAVCHVSRCSGLVVRRWAGASAAATCDALALFSGRYVMFVFFFLARRGGETGGRAWTRRRESKRPQKARECLTSFLLRAPSTAGGAGEQC